jgi:biotin carboxylase
MRPGLDPVLIVQPFDVHVQAAIGLGMPVVTLYDRAQTRTEIGRRLSEVVPTLQAELTDPIALAQAFAVAQERFGVYQVVQFSDERRMEDVARGAQSAGLLTEHPEAYRNLNNKEAFLEVASDIGVVHRQWCSASRRDALRQVERGEGPWVLKPADGSGSRGIRYAEAWNEVEPHLSGSGWVLEQYLSGVEYSVETLSVHGVHHAFGITAKTTTGVPRFIERAHVFPAVLGKTLADSVLDAVFRFLDAAGYANGPAHTEVMLHAGGIDLIESQARLGGDRIPALIVRATGINPEVELIRSLSTDWVPPEATLRARACIRYVELPHGILRSGIGLSPDGLDQGLEVQAVAQPGSHLGRAKSSSQRHAAVIGNCGDQDPPALSSRSLRAVVMPETDRPRPTLVLFGGTDEQVAQCISLGHQVLLVQAHDQLTEYQSLHCAGYVICDIGSRSNVDWAATQLAPFTDLPFVSVRQYGVLFRALVCEKLGLEPLSATECSATAADKGALRRRVDQLNLPRPAWSPVASDEDIRKFCADHDGRGVLKIARGTGGVGVRVVTLDHEVPLQALRSRVREVLPGGVTAGGFIIEEQLEGRLFSLESVWVRGRHVPLGVTTTEVSESSSAELRHTFPGDLPEPQARSAQLQVERLFSSLGMFSGGSHVEFIVSDAVPTIIDAHDRPAGGHIPELIDNALGVSSTNLALAAQTGQLTVETAQRLRAAQVSVVQFVTSRTSRVLTDVDKLRRAISYVRAMAGVKQVHFEVDSLHVQAEIDNWTRPGYVIAVGASPAAAEKTAEAACARLTEAFLDASVAGPKKDG